MIRERSTQPDNVRLARLMGVSIGLGRAADEVIELMRATADANEHDRDVLHGALEAILCLSRSNSRELRQFTEASLLPRSGVIGRHRPLPIAAGTRTGYRALRRRTLNAGVQHGDGCGESGWPAMQMAR